VHSQVSGTKKQPKMLIFKGASKFLAATVCLKLYCTFLFRYCYTWRPRCT